MEKCFEEFEIKVQSLFVKDMQAKLYLGLELLHGSCPIFRADGWITIFTVSAWLRNTILFWQKRNFGHIYFYLWPSLTCVRFPCTSTQTIYHSGNSSWHRAEQHAPSETHVLSVHPAHSPHMKEASLQETNEVLVLPEVRVSKRSTKFSKFTSWSTQSHSPSLHSGSHLNPPTQV